MINSFKEPWQETARERARARYAPQFEREGDTIWGESLEDFLDSFDPRTDAHWRIIVQAIAQGKPVPEEVISEYKEFAK